LDVPAKPREIAAALLFHRQRRLELRRWQRGRRRLRHDGRHGSAPGKTLTADDASLCGRPSRADPTVQTKSGPWPRRGLSEGPFAGVPFPLHDLCVSMAGSPTTGSSELFTGLV
jgi:hypothetical protein